MAGIGDKSWDRMKDIVQEIDAEEPSQDQGPPTDVDTEAVLARAKRQLGWQVTNPANYDAAPAVQASRVGTEQPAGTVPTDPPQADRQQAKSDVEDSETVARARRQLGL